MFERPTEKEIKKLRPKVKMGGSVTRNGKNVDKEIEKQTAKKYAMANKMRKIHNEEDTSNYGKANPRSDRYKMSRDS